MANGTGGGGRVTGDRRGWALGVGIGILRPILVLVTRRDWRGGGNIPATGGCVIAANHVSEFDPLATAHFVYDNGRLPRFLGKVEVFNVPLLGRLLRSAGQIPVYRQSADASKAFAAALEAVTAGRCVVVYPEGTISKSPQLWPMVGKTGAARIAMTSGCPLIPVAQWGPQLVHAPYQRRLHLFPRKVMRVTAGPPVDLADLAAQPMTLELLETATTRLMDAITKLLEEIRGEPAPRVRFDPKVEGISETGRPRAVPDDGTAP